MSQPGNNAVDRRMTLARQWDDLIAEVRALPRFEDFLRPPSLETLLPAAARGPVVTVNVSRWRCDALIVRTTGVTNLALNRLTLSDTASRAAAYLDVLTTAERADQAYLAASEPMDNESPRAAGKRLDAAAKAVDAAHEQVDEALTDLQAWLWDTIAEPVLGELGLTSTPDGPTASWPRLWWCLTGPLAVLPMHSAGYHRQAGARTVLDRVVSSYTPTLRALVEARRDHDQQDDGAHDRLLLVDVPDLPGLAPIDSATERAALLAAFPEDRRTVLDSMLATPQTVAAELRKHRWVHFSCHGDQHLDNPSHGGLMLRDGMLTVADITAGRFRGDFAGLSACKTAVGGADLPDEMITLAAALHYTGYRHVIAALWAVDNQVSAEVFGNLYRTIAADGELLPDRAPAALHDAVRTIRDRYPDWPHRWTPFIHTGP